MTYSILLADDEELEREALKLFIEEAKLPINKIIEAENGNMIVDKALNEKPDIIILDINMPGKTGLEALKIIREQKNHSKVIVSTAFSKIDNAIDAIHLGVVDFLIKPVSQQIFIESLKKTIETLNDEKNLSTAKNTKDNTDGATINEPDMVKKVCAYIETNYSKKISLNDIADHCGYSKFHLSRIFKANKDITVIDYLISQRIQISKKLLLDTNDSVKQISAQVGFSDPNYFTWTFKKLEGVSPMQYRAIKLSKS
ncbi:response regulator [Treponema parvum]|uniref:Response regulator n=1 Tax=Treponema parvum TaxID=138851 RepID=A0A975IFJ0_9SPIR|nr:response regulator [Treponema parvum]QTQ15031.1 response regulator [Treponema parvum]